MPGQSWDTSPFSLGPGDAILIPTDGLLDLHGGDLGRLTAAMAGRRQDDHPDVVVKTLCDRRGKRVILDDITAVLLRRDVPEGTPV